MPGPELSEKNITIKKGKDIVIEPELSLYQIGDAIVMTSPPAWPLDEEDVEPCIEVFALEGESRKHELERMVNVLHGILWTLGPFNSKHERYNMTIEVEDRENESPASGANDIS